MCSWLAKTLGGKTQYTLSCPWIEEYHVICGLEIVDKFRRELEYLDFARHMEKVEQVTREGDYFRYTPAGVVS